MAVFDGKRIPDGILASALSAGGNATNSVNVGRDYTLLEVAVVSTGGATFYLLKRGEQVMGPAGPTRVQSDLGQFVITTDNNNPSTGMVLSAGTNASGTFRVAYPRGEYTVFAGGTVTGTWSASYSLVGELR